MPVQVLKLINGETLLTDVLESTDKAITVINPLEIKTESNYNTTRMNMIAYQWMPMMEEENIMYINKQHIVGMSNATADMQEYYVDAIERILYPKRTEEKEREERQKLMEMIREYANTESKHYH